LGYWQQTYGQSVSLVKISDCAGGSFAPMPPSWLTLTQEPDAPMLSWEGISVPGGSTFFTESRLPSTMGLKLSPSVRVVNTSSDALNVDALLKLKSGSQSGYGIVMRPMANNSWRTLSCAFYCHSLSDGALLNLGPLNAIVTQGQLVLQWTSATLSGSFSLPIVANSTNPIYFVANMRSDYAGRYPNRLTMVAGSASDWTSGRISMTSFGSNGFSGATQNNSPLYNTSDASQLQIGATVSADVSIAWVRTFDYELNSTDVLRDVGNSWKREFIYPQGISNFSKIGGDDPANAALPDAQGFVLIDGPFYNVPGNSNSGFIGGLSWRRMAPAGPRNGKPSSSL
jgi:hypothetical protein